MGVIHKNFRLLETFRADREDYRGCSYYGNGFAEGDEVSYVEYDVFYENDGTESGGWTGLFHPACLSICEGQEVDITKPR